MNIKAVFGQKQENARMLDNKASIGGYVVVAYKDGKFYEPVTVRLWGPKSGKSGVVHCGLWVSNRNDFYTTGKGHAGGWGYHKPSEAIANAIDSAGITLLGSPYGRDVPENTICHIGGVGESAIQSALSAIAVALGYDTFTIVTV